jgi:predicted AlkP superfamily pyrophosphatase or phosphodiesterase
VKNRALVTRSAALLASVLLAGPGVSQTAPPKPKLIVAIAVDQLSSDLFNEYRTRFKGGLKRLEGGVVFPSGYQGHAATETCPGHSTILTGSRPSRTGIIANDWQNPSLIRRDKSGRPTTDVYCAEKPGAAGSNAGEQVISADFLRVPTLGDRMKTVDPQTKVVSVSVKDRAAVMLGGHNADLTLWWNGKAFVSYAGRAIQIAPALNAINARVAAAIAKPGSVKLPAGCEGYSRATPVSATGSVGVLAPRKAGEESGWRAGPESDAAIADVALAARSEMRLGEGAATDLLAVSFSATDYVGHRFGTSGAEMCAQLSGLDATIGRLLAGLDKSGVPYIVVLTADHGGHDLPERNRDNGLPNAERVDVALSARAVGAKVGAQFGMTESALLGRGVFGDTYLSTAVPADKRAAVRAAAVALYRAHRQVAAVFTKDELIATPSPTTPVEDWSLIERARASFDAERSGDFIVLLKPYVTPIPSAGLGYVATHGSPWGYDRRVPILFWWKGVAPFEQPNGVETADIMPTLASLIGLPVPVEEIDGRCIDIVAGGKSNC